MSSEQQRRTATRARLIRVVVVEPLGLVRALLRDILGSRPDITIVAEASDIDEAIAVVRDESPDVVVVDPDRPVSHAVAALQRLKRECPGAPVVLLGHRADDDEELFAAIQAGVAAHVVDDARPSDLVQTIRAVAEGTYLIDQVVAARPTVALRVLEAFRDASMLGDVAPGELAEMSYAPLSAREAEILLAIAQGMTNKEVGEALAITEHTVKNHVTSILRKLAVNGRTQAVLYAIKRSWIGVADEPPRRH